MLLLNATKITWNRIQKIHFLFGHARSACVGELKVSRSLLHSIACLSHRAGKRNQCSFIKRHLGLHQSDLRDSESLSHQQTHRVLRRGPAVSTDIWLRLIQTPPAEPYTRRVARRSTFVLFLLIKIYGYYRKISFSQFHSVSHACECLTLSP